MTEGVASEAVEVSVVETVEAMEEVAAVVEDMEVVATRWGEGLSVFLFGSFYHTTPPYASVHNVWGLADAVWLCDQKRE